jgi:integral membrane protein (TIGR01906 family)
MMKNIYNNKLIRNVIHWLFILCIPILLLTTSIRIASNSAELYRYGFSKYNISQVTGLSPTELNKAIGGLITYFNDNSENISLTLEKNGQPFVLFNEREVGHLRDVKALFRLNYRLLLGTLIFCFVSTTASYMVWQDKRRVARELIGGSALTIVLLIALGLMTWVNFDWFFYEFHLISFSNDLWLLDPSSDYLIMLFPEGFWYDAAIFCGLFTAVMALILGGTGWWRLRKEKTIEKEPDKLKVDGKRGI